MATHTLVLSTSRGHDGQTLGAFCFGANDFGQFNGTPGSGLPSPTAEPSLDGLAFDMRQADHGCGIVGDGVRCWGANDQGQIGNGKTEPFSAAYDVPIGP